MYKLIVEDNGLIPLQYTVRVYSNKLQIVGTS
jgi:hypothetical protein